MSLQDRRWHIDQCNRCHQCKLNPVAKSQRFSGVCPAIDHGHFHAYSGSGKNITAFALIEGRAQYTPALVESVTTCSMCGACDTACRNLQGDIVAPMETIYALRAKMHADGQVPAAQRELLTHIAVHGNPFGRPRGERSHWARDLPLRDATREKVELLLHVGCANAFDEARWAGLRSVAQELLRSGQAVGTLGAHEGHAGALAYALGDHDLARRCAETLATQVAASGASMLVTCDAESLSAFRNFYPRLGVSLEPARVLHISEYLASLAPRERRPESAGREEVVTYHDPCHLGRLAEPYVPWQGEWTTAMNGMRVSVPPQPPRFGLGGVYDAPRQLLRGVPGTRLVEMERHREFSYCCGAGGGGREAHPAFAEQAALSRLEEARATGATTLVTSCSGCTRHLRDTAQRHGLDLQVTELVDYLAGTTA